MLRIDREQIAKLPPDQQQEALALLEQYESALRENPLLGYEPHAKQRKFHESRDPLKCFWGGNQSGKTTAGLLDDIIQAVDADCLPPSLLPYKKFEPPFLCRIVCPDFTRNMEGVIFHKLREWLPRDQLVGGEFGKAYDKTQKVLRFKNSSEFDFLSFEQDLDKFGGATKDRIHYDEEPPENIRREGLMRLMARNGDELFTMTPLLGLSWMYDALYEPYSKGLLREATVVRVDMDENPHLHPDAKRRALAGMSREEREARKSGRFVHFAGMIYDEFSRNFHVIPEIPELPPDVRVYVGIDPGMRHMAAVVWAYLTAEDTLVVFDELALQGHTVKQVAEAIKLVNQKWGQKTEKGIVPLVPDWYVIDPSARNVVHQTGRSDQMEFTDHGIVTILGQNSVTAGINRVKERLQSHRLLVTANCQTLIDQFRKYRWKTQTRSENDPKEEPVKSDDHCFPAGTMIETERGPRRIETIRIGDRVWTRGGLCPVIASAPTRKAPMQTVCCSDGSQLTGTEDHPIPVEREGRMHVAHLDSLRYGDILLSCISRRNSRESSSVATPRRRTAQAGSISNRGTVPPAEGSRICTGRFTRRIMGRSPLAGTFTTGTAIRSTTIQPTSSVSRSKSTWASTAGRALSRSPAAPTIDSVRTSARARTDAQADSMTSSVPARTAGPSFRSTVIPGLATARVSVLSKHAAPAAEAYNLTVYGHSEYFADGVLVLNCLDALRYIVASRPYPSEEELEEQKPMNPLERAMWEDVRGIKRKRQVPKTAYGGVFA